jgi:streptogramin lyase
MRQYPTSLLSQAARILVSLASILTLLVAESATAQAQATDDYVWIAGRCPSCQIVKIQKSTNTVVGTIPLGADPFGVAVDQESVWATHYGGTGLSRINKSTNSVTVVALPQNPFGVAVDTDSAWVTSVNVGIVSRVSKSSNAVVASVPVGPNAWGIAVDQDSVWVARDGFVTRISKSTNQVLVDIPIGSSPRGIAATDPDYVWVANWGSLAVQKISKATNAVVTTIDTSPHQPHGIAVGSDAVWVATYESGSILKIDKQTEFVTTVPIVNRPNLLHGVSLDANSVWTDSYFDATVYRLDRSTTQFVATIPTGTAFTSTFRRRNGLHLRFLVCRSATCRSAAGLTRDRHEHIRHPRGAVLSLISPVSSQFYERQRKLRNFRFTWMA